jgi:hypothetical protein
MDVSLTIGHWWDRLMKSRYAWLGFATLSLRELMRIDSGFRR